MNSNSCRRSQAGTWGYEIIKVPFAEHENVEDGHCPHVVQCRSDFVLSERWPAQNDEGSKMVPRAVTDNEW